MAIDDGYTRAAVVDEGLLAGPVLLAQAALLARPPRTVAPTEAAVAVGPLTVQGDVLGPQQLQGHTLALELLVDLEEVVGFDEPVRLRLGREQHRHQRRFIRVLGKRPGQGAGLG